MRAFVFLCKLDKMFNQTQPWSWLSCPLQTGGLSSETETTRLQEEGVPHPFRANYLTFLEGAECPGVQRRPAGVCLVIHMIRQGDAGAPKLGCLFVT